MTNYAIASDADILTVSAITMQPGDVINIAPGLYGQTLVVSGSGTSSAPIIIRKTGASEAKFANIGITRVSGDWSDLGSNIWRTTLPSDHTHFGLEVNSFLLAKLGVSTIARRLDASETINADTLFKFDRTTKQIDLFSVGNPVTYYGGTFFSRYDQCAIHIDADHVVVENGLVFEDMWGGINASTGLVARRGLTIEGFTSNRLAVGALVRPYFEISPFYYDVVIRNVNCTNHGSQICHIQYNVVGYEVHHCTADSMLLTESSGVINTGAGVSITTTYPRQGKIHHNTINNVKFNRYFLGDGSAIYLDEGTADTDVYANKITNCEGQAFQNNSGRGINRFFGNITDTTGTNHNATLDKGGEVIRISDSKPIGEGHTLIYNNVFLNPLYGPGIRDSGLRTELRNNIVSGASVGIKYTVGETANFIETDNCFHNVTTVSQQFGGGAGTLIYHSTDITSDPLVNGSTYEIGDASPARRTGTALADSYFDFNDLRIGPVPDMGAKQKPYSVLTGIPGRQFI